MEESTEAHMETDVSSTTEDVPEAQEVSASNGNNEVVEMVVIVEKVSEDDDSSSQQSDTPPQVIEAVTGKSASPHASPNMSTSKVSQSPTKAIEKQKSPGKPMQTLSPEKVINNTIEVTLDQPQCEQTVDSSTKTEPEKLQSKSNPTTPTKNATVKPNPVVVEPQNITQTSPTKDQGLNATNKSPSKEAQAPNSEKNSPNKVQVSEESSKDEKPVETDTNQNSDVSNDKNTLQSLPQVDLDKEISNDSQVDITSETSEKDHNKSISRELKSLINSAKESKIISECTQLTSKTRKSRVPLDASNTSLNTSVEAEKIQEKRRNSDNSQKSNCSEKSDKTTVKRSMRSQNPEFVNKVKQFLNSVTSKVQKESDEGTDDEVMVEAKAKEVKNEPSPHLLKKKKDVEIVVRDKPTKLRLDPYCWRCHWAVEQAPNEKVHPPMTCTVCPRAYHYKCLSGAEKNKINTEKSWVCPECMAVLHAESSETRSSSMKKITLGKLCELLKHAIQRMMELNGVEPFLHPVDRTAFPDYEKYVVHPMDLSQMKHNITAGLYGSTEAFIADTQWILHNSIIFNTLQSKLTSAARTLVRSCRAEMGEIEACPECYAAAHAHRPTWFSDVCSTPHILLWAKLKGFPYWPAKGMSVNGSGLVDVRFFGAHDRAWVPAKDCYLYSEKDPNNFRTKRLDIIDSMREAEQHIRNISRKYGKFVYPPFKIQFEPSKFYEQLQMMIPSFEGEVRPHIKKPLTTSPSMVKEKRRSHSKCSKGSSHNEGDTSEGDEAPSTTSRKMADGAEIAKMDDDSVCEKDKTMEVDTPTKEESSRKRRRSDLEEAVITIIESSKEKKKKVDSNENKVDSKESQPTNSGESPQKSQVPDITDAKHIEVKIKDNEPSSSTSDKSQKVAPIKLVISTKANKSAITAKPKIKVKLNSSRIPPIKLKQIKLNESVIIERNKRKSEKSKRRRSSKSNKSLNNSNTVNSSNTSKPEKHVEKKNEKNSESAKEKPKEDENSVKNKEESNKSVIEKPVLRSTDSPKATKERTKFDDNTSLAVLAREAKNSVTNSNIIGMPTISSVRSLSTTAQNTTTNTPPKTTTSKTIEVSIEAPSESSVFTPTSTDNVRNVKEAVNKLQKLKGDNNQSLVGRVGVRAFARMTSPEKPKDNNKTMQVEIKSEPIDLDLLEDADRHMEKMDLMRTFKLRPVNPSNLREVRINKVNVNKVLVPCANQKKVVGKPECKPRARKTFPQPKKPDEGRSELNSKNSMVYIPIQPPVTPVPVRGTRITPVSVSDNSLLKTAPVNNIQNAVNATNTTTPNVSSASNNVPLLTNATSTSALTTTSATVTIPTVGQVPTTVQTVPLITSVNGQWTFSLQPIMSVGVDDDFSAPLVNSQPLVNGISDRSTAPPLVPITPALTSAPNSLATSSVIVPSGPVIVPSAPMMLPTAPIIVPASVSHSVIIPSPPAALTTSSTMTSSTPIMTPTRMVDAVVTPGEPPRLQQRPALVNPFDAQAPSGNVPVPASAGPLTAKLNQNSVKLMDFFRTLLEDSLEMLDDPAAQTASLRLQLEQTRWKHRQEIEELKHNHELTLSEMRSSFEKEKGRIINEMRAVAQIDLDAAVKVAKSKQWCANCRQEAQFYCCWNTSYCDYPCQRAHWADHFAVCTQVQKAQAQGGENSADGITNPLEIRLQPHPDHTNTVPPAVTPMLTVGGKVTSRGDQHAQKGSSIIMSMEKDSSGNSKLKCVGTYKAPTPATTQISPIIINKQIIDDAAKKVVTSGGYLIVGASTNPPAQVITARRHTPTIQYFS